MNFLTDANVFVPMIDGLRKLQHDVYDIKEQGLGSLPDKEVFTLAQNLKRIIITFDKDFSNILLYPPGEHEGIIIVKLSRLKINAATKIFLNTIKNFNENEIHSNIVIIDHQKIRIRKEKF